MVQYQFHFQQLTIKMVLSLLHFGFLIGHGQKSVTSKNEKQISYIFSEEHLDLHFKDLHAIHSKMADYYEGVERSNITLLDRVFSEDWCMRDTDTPNEATLNVESKQKFIERVAEHGPYPGYAENRKFTTVGLTDENLAFVRVNKKSSTSFFLYKIGGKWMITDKIWAHIRASSKEINRASDYAEIENILYRYFKALQSGSRNLLDEILDKDWDFKYLDSDNSLQIIGKNTFLTNLPSGDNYIDYNQLLSIDLYHGKLAIARVDDTTKKVTSFLIFFKVDGKWTLVAERASSGQVHGI